jgi:hypothetical protein
MEGQVVRAAPIDPADQPAQRVPRHVHLLEDRLLIFGGFADVRSRGRRSRDFPFPTLMVSSWLVVSSTLLETVFFVRGLPLECLVAGFFEQSGRVLRPVFVDSAQVFDFA